MKSFFQKFKFIAGIFFQVLLSLAVLAVSWGMSTTNIDLNTCPKAEGTVSTIGVGTDKDFLVSLNGSDAKYWVFRSSGNYQNITDSVGPGSAVTIYHSPTKDKHQYYTVCQLNTVKNVVYSKTEYEGTEQLAGRFIGLPAGFIMLGIIFYTTRKKLRQQKQVIEV